jgi:hypothetical protein
MSAYREAWDERPTKYPRLLFRYHDSLPAVFYSAAPCAVGMVSQIKTARPYIKRIKTNESLCYAGR